MPRKIQNCGGWVGVCVCKPGPQLCWWNACLACTSLGFASPTTHRTGVLAPICNPNTWELEARVILSDIESQVSQGFRKSCLKQQQHHPKFICAGLLSLGTQEPRGTILALLPGVPFVGLRGLSFLQSLTPDFLAAYSQPCEEVINRGACPGIYFS